MQSKYNSHSKVPRSGRRGALLAALVLGLGAACGDAGAPFSHEEFNASKEPGGSGGAGSGSGGMGGGSSSAGAGTGRGASTGPGGSRGSGGTGGAGGSGGVGSSASTGTTGSSASSASAGAGGGEVAPVAEIAVRLVPAEGVEGTQRVNFAVPLPKGVLVDPGLVRIASGAKELPASRRALARHPDGSVRSVQVQVELEVEGEVSLDVGIGASPSAGTLDSVPVEATLVEPSGALGPRVWALLPATHLAQSGAFGPLVTEKAAEGTPGAAWAGLCDYEAMGVSAFLSQMASGPVWLYDRGTVFYRGHARRGDLATLETAYRETAIYRDRIKGTGAGLQIGVPDKVDDIRYHYGQNLALHYLMTGDDRFREAAESMADKMVALWDPAHPIVDDSGDGFEDWSERRAGFYLLAQLFAAQISDDRGPELSARADAAVSAFLDVQASKPPGYADPDARCFAHHALSHAEPFGYWGCSPWMSAILADALESYASEREGAPADAARQAIVKLGRMLAARRAPSGRPHYWIGVGTAENEPDPADEHWGESAYVVAMAWHLGGRKEPALRAAAAELVFGLASRGEAPHMRSFNWQCRSAVATPAFLLP